MTKQEKIHKLANAIRAYRGLKRGERYVHAPTLSARNLVAKSALRLGLDAGKTISLANSFTTVEGFNTWLRTL